jgi:hypothetical protein
LVLLLRLGGTTSADEAASGRRQVSLGARMLVNLLIAEVFQQVHGIARHRSDEMPIFLGLAEHMPVLLKHVLRQENIILIMFTYVYFCQISIFWLLLMSIYTKKTGPEMLSGFELFNQSRVFCPAPYLISYLTSYLIIYVLKKLWILFVFSCP